LLFDYLRSAEELERLYAEEYDRWQRGRASAECEVRCFETPSPSGFAQALARKLATDCEVSSEVHWGNEGFCVDVALRHPTRAEDVTLGVLCDGTRFSKAPDRVEWDLFRTAVLEGQGWKLLRLWTPQFFRDPQSAVQAIVAGAAEIVAQAPYPTPEAAPGRERMLN
ncbi:MAG TPA: DNA helicase, partial [Myxococcales bacterium]|nr:DNA helicase [Myxococcales bacterium]